MAYVPPHRRSKQASTNGGEDDDDNNAKVFCDAFSIVRCINLDHRSDKWKQIQNQASKISGLKIERFSAVVGDQDGDDRVKPEWDTTTNARWDHKIPPHETRYLSPGEIGCALSHVTLWEELISEYAGSPTSTMLVLEDDACFFRDRNGGQGASRFLRVFGMAWNHLPHNWGILYLGFSDRGERTKIFQNSHVEIFQPTYGFHTHAYVITQQAARTLLEHLPVIGPVDVWLADNSWFGIPVYSAVVANEGWKRSGAPLIYQNRRPGSTDVAQSGRSTHMN